MCRDIGRFIRRRIPQRFPSRHNWNRTPRPSNLTPWPLACRSRLAPPTAPGSHLGNRLGMPGSPPPLALPGSSLSRPCLSDLGSSAAWLHLPPLALPLPRLPLAARLHTVVPTSVPSIPPGRLPRASRLPPRRRSAALSCLTPGCGRSTLGLQDTKPPCKSIFPACASASNKPRILFQDTPDERTVYLGPWEVVGSEQRRVLWQCSYQNELLEHYCMSSPSCP